MDNPIPPAITQLTDTLTQNDGDDLAQFQALTAALAAIPDLQHNLAAARATVVQRLKHDRTWEQVGELTGLHWARASQIARAGTKKV